MASRREREERRKSHNRDSEQRQDQQSSSAHPSQTLRNGKCLKQKIWTSSSWRGSIKNVVRIFPIQPPNSPLHFVSSFCCLAFGGQTSLLSGAQVLQTPQTNLLQCPLHLCVQLLLPGIWRSMFSFLPRFALCTFVFFYLSTCFVCILFNQKWKWLFRLWIL